MKIVFLAWRDLANPLAGGSEVLVDRLASGMVERGHDVTLIAGGPVGDRSYRVENSGGVFTQYLKAPWLATRHHRDADVVIDVCNGIPFFAPLWRRRPTICLVNHIHTEQWPLWFPPMRAAIGHFVESRLLPRLYGRTQFMAVSPSTASALESIGVSADRIQIVPNGVDSSLTPATKSSTPLFVALGRMVPHKRYDLLVELWERVQPVTGGRLIIAGDGPDLVRLSRTPVPGLELPGRISDEKKVELLGSAWLFLHPAMLEGWGLVIMEAATLGTPTIGFVAPGVRDAVSDGESGLLAASPDEFVDLWIGATSDSALRLKLSDGARRRSTHFGWDRTADRFESLVRQTAGQSTPWRVVDPLGSDVPPHRAQPEVSIIIPAFNEERRLGTTLEKLIAFTESMKAEIIVVDDGSTDATSRIAEDMLQDIFGQVRRLPQNLGKGAAVRAGVQAATGRNVVFMDADLATDLSYLPVVLEALEHSHIAIGSRAAPGSVTTGGSRGRAAMGRSFNRFARAITRMGIRDFQCGFKAFRGPSAKLLFHMSEIDGYAFDVEILALARRVGYSISELPVSWHAVPGSHIRPLRDSLEMGLGVIGLPARWTSKRAIAAIRASSRREDDPSVIVDRIHPYVRGCGPVVPWRHGALALLPFSIDSDVRALSNLLRAEIPSLNVDVDQVTVQQVLESNSLLRTALARG